MGDCDVKRQETEEKKPDEGREEKRKLEVIFITPSRKAIESYSLCLELSRSSHLFSSFFSQAVRQHLSTMLLALAWRVARRAGGDAAVALINAAAPMATPSAAEIGNVAASSSSLLPRSCFSSFASAASTSGASSSFSATAAAASGSWLRRYSAAFFTDLTPPPANAPPNPVGAASHLKAALKPRQGRNRFARAWKRAGEAQADARRRKHETSVALAVRDAKRRRRWAAAGAAARGGAEEVL